MSKFLKNLNMPNGLKEVLFLACHLPEMAKNEFDTLYRNLSERLQDSQGEIKPIQKFITLDDFQDFILENKPNIIHIVGHRLLHDTNGVKKEYHPFLMKEDQGIVLINNKEEGKPIAILTGPLTNLFKLFSEDDSFNIQALILDSCYNKEQAISLSKVIPYVIGLKNNIKLEASIAFSRGFYKAISQNMQMEFSFKMGQNRIEIEFGEEEINKIFLHP